MQRQVSHQQDPLLLKIVTKSAVDGPTIFPLDLVETGLVLRAGATFRKVLAG